MIEKDIRKEITERWMQAVDELIKNGSIMSYRDLEAKTGIQNQRITLIKAFIKDPEKNRTSYAHIDYLFHLIDKFDVSWIFLFYGDGPIISKVSNQHVFAEDRAEYTKKETISDLKDQVKDIMKRLEKMDS